MSDGMIRDRIVRQKNLLFRGTWHLLAVLLVILLPASIKFREPFWEVPAEHVPSLLAMALAYLAGAWIVEAGLASSTAPTRARVALLLLLAALSYPLALGLMLLRPELPYSRAIVVLAALLGLGLLLLSLVPRRGRVYAMGLLVLGVGLTAGTGVYRAGIPRASPFGFTLGEERPSIMTGEQFLEVTYQKEPVGHQPVRGGALVPLDEGFLLVTGAGEFYRLGWDEHGDTLEAERLPLESPANRDEFIADVGGDGPGRYFRLADILFDKNDSPEEVYVSHHSWNRKDKCFTLSVSVAPIAHGAVAGGTTPWRTLFDSIPCLPVTSEFENSIQSGGRMAWLPDGRLLVTVGDHGFDGMAGEDLPQDAGAAYGKTIAIHPDGTHATYALGLRNPQGLALDAAGRVWITDQGPEGGDELNLVVEGGNYGWPLVTYGTQYQMTYWPLAEGKPDHGEFAEPVYVWVPSPAISGLMAVSSALFPAWQGDLLASSLRSQSLFRIRLRGAEVVYAEPIRIGRRIRDLAEGHDGRIVLWTETGDLVTIRPGDASSSGQALFSQCVACHEASAGQAGAAPSLRGVVGRPVASVPGYEYSAALKQLGGSWELPRLEAYLRDPNSVAPGTTMSFTWRGSDAELRTLLEYLRQYD